MCRASSPSRCRGFTVIELMVVLAILMFAIGLLLPALQAIRAAAARAQSQNNLKQMVLAVHATQDAHNKLPPAIGFFPVNAIPPNALEQKPALHGTLFYHILPFIEQDNVYKITAGMSRNATGIVIPIYLASGDFTAPAKGLNSDMQGAISYAANGYVFGGGTWDKKNKAYFSKTTLPQIAAQDGTSNTIALGERFASCVIKKDGKETTIEHAWSEDGKDRGPESPVVWKHDLLPQFDATKTTANPEAFQGFSASSIQMGLFDGSVRSVISKISQQTWSNAMRHDDGNPLGADW